MPAFSDAPATPSLSTDVPPATAVVQAGPPAQRNRRPVGWPAILLVILSLLTAIGSAAGGPAVSTASVSLAGPWDFTLDPLDQGIARRWFDPATPFPATRTIQTGQPLSEQGIPNYAGVSWLRRTVVRPQGW